MLIRMYLIFLITWCLYSPEHFCFWWVRDFGHMKLDSHFTELHISNHWASIRMRGRSISRWSTIQKSSLHSLFIFFSLSPSLSLSLSLLSLSLSRLTRYSDAWAFSQPFNDRHCSCFSLHPLSDYGAITTCCASNEASGDCAVYAWVAHKTGTSFQIM